ncbi:hypothetical protein C4J97_2302 [Pseudomonas orientalis]|nr:hypothetical protein C4J97_2302 [Pseudomonas orientalis]
MGLGYLTLSVQMIVTIKDHKFCFYGKGAKSAHRNAAQGNAR